MKKKLSILIACLLGSLTAFAQDTVELKNGDVITGKVLGQDAHHVYFRSSAFGAVSLSLRDIAQIHATAEEVGAVNVPEQVSVTGPKPEPKPATTPKPVASPTLAATPKAEPKPAPKPAPKPKKIDRWSGQAGLAIAMRQKTSSNQRGIYRDEKYETYRLYGNLDWKGVRNDLRWNWTYRYSRDEYRKRDDYFNITQKYKHSFANQNLYASAKTLYQRDYNRRIDNEYLQTAELGVKWFGKDSKIQLNTSLGGGYHKYDRLDSSRTETTSVSQPKFILDEALRWQLINSLTLIQKYTHLGDTKDYHQLFSAGLENKLVQDLFLRLEYRLDRDTEVLYDDRGYYDRALLTSILYKF